ncbi:MAG: tetratricopeptide repeat protein [Cyclobacteriaceae bacterium]|nr:tetratricopeptide repeat protein [Cyclobacteriaceae bacterium]
MQRKLLILISLLIVGCAEKNNENKLPEEIILSLSGKEYTPPELTATQQAKLDSNLQVAIKNFEALPSEENFIWYGRRQAYLYNYQKAISIFTEGLKKYPESFRLYRHRGHRYITIREFDKAIVDLTKAAELMKGAPLEIEPDGQPNKINKPLSSTQFNVWYHLGLAYYLKGDFTNAEKAYLECMKVSDNDDLITASVDWLYMTYRRQNKNDEATVLLEKIHDTMNIIENDSYLKRLNLYKGLLPVDSVLNVTTNNEDVDLALATQGYGVGNWYLYNGDTTQAIEIFDRVLAGKHYAAFGFIAAEADRVRLKKE